MNVDEGPGSQPYKVEVPPVVAPPLVVNEPQPAPDDALCRGCGYALRGLRSDRNCPECGMAIERSIAGNLLIFSSAEYLQSLHKGITWALIANLIACGLAVLAIPVTVLATFKSLGPITQDQVEMAARLVSFPLAGLTFIGWWMFSLPDPAVLADDQGDKPRRILRLTLWAVLVYAVCDVVLVSLGTGTGQFVVGGLMVLAAIVQLVQFFATLLYIRWVAPRIPDAAMAATCTRYLWLLPLIYVLGICVFGPIIVLVMYLILMNNVRIHLGRIRRQQQQVFATA